MISWLAIRNIGIGEPLADRNNGLSDYTWMVPRGNLIENNYLCTDRTGAANPPFAQGDLQESGGVYLAGEARENMVRGNLIAGCTGQITDNWQAAVTIEDQATLNVVQGNRIGFDVNWNTRQNSLGILVTGRAAVNCIGNDTCIGTAFGGKALLPKREPGCGANLGDSPCNYVGNSVGEGILVQDMAWENRITGNFIGVGRTGVEAAPNGKSGVLLAGGAATQIGGSKTPANPNQSVPGWKCAGDCNVISANAGAGVRISGVTQKNTVKGNLIGSSGNV